MNPLHQIIGGHTVATDLLYEKKSAFLNLPLFTGVSSASSPLDLALGRLRKASFTQDSDGDVKWTHEPQDGRLRDPARRPDADGRRDLLVQEPRVPLVLDHVRGLVLRQLHAGGLSLGVLIMLWLYERGDFKGILKTDHLWAIGQLMLTFTVFWATSPSRSTS
jgi:hypothetical protein